MLSNLLGNAVSHGAEGRSIQIVAKHDGGDFVPSATNERKMIPADQLPSLFLPFHQGALGSKRAGLGLGLYVASEIAKAHGGTLSVVSDETQTKFTFRMSQA